jgi:hypothetical protein
MRVSICAPIRNLALQFIHSAAAEYVRSARATYYFILYSTSLATFYELTYFMQYSSATNTKSIISSICALL